MEWFASGTIDPRKFEEFLLSPTHPVGKHKLRLWQSVFDIGEGDGRLLEGLIREQLKGVQQIVEKEPKRDRDDPDLLYRRFELVIPDFEGPEGNMGPVLTAWTHDQRREYPHLTTALPIVD